MQSTFSARRNSAQARLSLQEIAKALGGEIFGDQVRAPGPGHSPKDRSLIVWLSDSDPAGFTVHPHASGDDPIRCKDYVREKLGLPPWQSSRFNERDHTQAKRKIAATYDYADADGKLLYQVVRYEPKGFSQRRPDGNDGWIWKLENRRILYRWPELLKFPDATVFFTEGEKDADRLASLGHCATTVASGSWTDECARALAGRDVVILEDNDEPGRKRALDAANVLHGIAKTIRIVKLPDLPYGKDVSDWLDADPARGDQLAAVCFDAPVWVPSAEEAATPILIKSSGQFVSGFTPPDYMVDGLMQEAFLYSLTGATGAGKTLITLKLAASVALGIPFAGRETKKGQVLYLAAENPSDVRMRWIALSQRMDFDLNEVAVFFVEDVFKISQMKEALRQEAFKVGGEFSLVIVDTGPVFYEGDDENNRKQQGEHAVMLRDLIKLIPGKPTVLVNCHPVKNASPDNLLPAGGGNFLNQVDGNLTAARTDANTEMHWRGKYRGVDFAPMCFAIKTVTHESLKDSKGRLIPTVICEWISAQAQEEINAKALNDEDQVLAMIEADSKISTAAIAMKLGWKMHNGEPYKMRAQRVLDRLIKEKLIKKTRAGHHHISEKGREELKPHDVGSQKKT
jgi:hypothetical protein